MPTPEQLMSLMDYPLWVNESAITSQIPEDRDSVRSAIVKLSNIENSPIEGLYVEGEYQVWRLTEESKRALSVKSAKAKSKSPACFATEKTETKTPECDVDLADEGLRKVSIYRSMRWFVKSEHFINTENTLIELISRVCPHFTENNGGIINHEGGSLVSAFDSGRFLSAHSVRGSDGETEQYVIVSVTVVEVWHEGEYDGEMELRFARYGEWIKLNYSAKEIIRDDDNFNLTL